METITEANKHRVLDISDSFPAGSPQPSRRRPTNGILDSTVFGCSPSHLRIIFQQIIENMLDTRNISKMLNGREIYLSDTSNDSFALGSVVGNMKVAVLEKDNPTEEEKILLFVIKGKDDNENYNKRLLAEWLLLLAENAKSEGQVKCFVIYVLQHLFNDKSGLSKFRSTLEVLHLADTSDKGVARLTIVRCILGGSTSMDTVVNAFNAKVIAMKPENKRGEPNAKILPTLLKSVCNYWAMDDFTKGSRASLQQVFETLTLAPVEEGIVYATTPMTEETSSVELQARLHQVVTMLEEALSMDSAGLISEDFKTAARNFCNLIPSAITSDNRANRSVTQSPYKTLFGDSSNGSLSISMKGLRYCFCKNIVEKKPSLARHATDVWQWNEQDNGPTTDVELAQCGCYWTIGMFEIIEVVGGGNFGRVVKARLKHDPSITVVIKLEAFSVDHFKQYFKREVLDGSKVKHKNIIKTLGYFPIADVGNTQKPICMGLILEEGRHTLQNEADRILVGLSQDEKIPHICRMIKEVLDGALALEQAGVIHRDLKPENILVGADGCIKIADFGLARERAPNEADMTQQVGTGEYIPPEEGGTKHDVFSIGVIMWKLMKGATPAQKDINRHDVAEAFNVESALGNEVVDLCTNMIKQCASARFTLREAADELGRIIAKMPE